MPVTTSTMNTVRLETEILMPVCMCCSMLEVRDSYVRFL